MVILALLFPTLACWSSDTAFIRLTDTPMPTPVPPTPEIESLFSIGDAAVVAGQGVASIYLTVQPEPVTRRNRVPGAGCYPNTTVAILAVEVADGVTYYQIACNDSPGWLAEEFLRAP